jgi:hypothetical protein
MTTGPGLWEILVLGARLRLLALDGATDIALDLVFFLLGVKFEAALEGGEGDSESLLKEATSAWSSHLPTRPNASSDEMASDFGVATWLVTVGGE